LLYIIVSLLIIFFIKKCAVKYPYPVNMDYQYTFDNARIYEIEIVDNQIVIPNEILKNDIVFIEISLKSKLLGRYFTPKIELVTIDEKIVHFFEKGLNGIRYLNITDFTGYKLNLRVKFLKLANKRIKIIVYNRYEKSDGNIMILAPHPDDAEISSYGFYSHFSKNTSIVTISMGEGSYNNYNNIYSQTIDSRVRKGSIRFWESLCIPKLGGVELDKCINLGYYGGLKRVYQNNFLYNEKLNDIRGNNISSMMKFLSREFSWENLISDLVKLIEINKPDIIVTPYPKIDSDIDHKLASLAIFEAIRRSHYTDCRLFLYTNHFTLNELYPYGQRYTSVTLPPLFEELYFDYIFSFSLSLDKQKEKLFIFDSMIDVRNSIQKRFFRESLKWFFHTFNRDYLCGDDYTYFRRAIRRDELFFVVEGKNIFDDGILNKIMGDIL